LEINLWDFKLLQLQDEYVQPVEYVSGQLGEHEEEEQHVEEEAGLQPGFAQGAEMNEFFKLRIYNESY